MVLVLPVLIGLAVGFLLGGRIERLAALRLRGLELFAAAFVVQVVAFPFPWLPWTTDDRLATALWLGSFALVAVGAWLNRHLVGMPLVAAGLASNVVAVGVNGGHMPALPGALAAANESYVVSNNSEQIADPSLAWLVDRWAVPDWLPVGNVYSLGDILIAVGIMAIVVVTMRTGVPRPRAARATDKPALLGQ